MIVNDPEARLLEIAQDDFNIVIGAAHKGASIILTPEGEVTYAFSPSALPSRLYTAAFRIAYQSGSPDHREALDEMALLLPPSYEVNNDVLY